MNWNGTIGGPVCVSNPKGIPSQSPGLRRRRAEAALRRAAKAEGTSYPGCTVREVSNPNGVVSFGSRRCAATPLGLKHQSNRVPRVVASLQYVFSVMVGMARCAVPARVVAGATNIRVTLAFEEIAPLHAARTSQRDVPTTLTRYASSGGAGGGSSALVRVIRGHCFGFIAGHRFRPVRRADEWRGARAARHFRRASPG